MPDREPPPPPPSVGHAFLHGPFVRPPRTPVGWWSVALAAAYVALSAIQRLVLDRASTDASSPSAIATGFEVVALAVGVATAATVAIALWRRAERSWLLGVPLLIGLGTVVERLGAAFGGG